MKEDYLWDKTGSDSEIEDLEKTLKSFRSSDTFAPDLPQKHFVAEKKHLQNEKPRRFSFQLAFAAFAFLGLIILSVGIFQALSIDDRKLAQNNSKEIADQQNIEKPFIKETNTIAEPNFEKEIIQRKVKKAEFVSKPKQRTAEAKQQIRTKVKRNKVIANRTQPKIINDQPQVRTVKLTTEEKDAYDQLMRALAITGSQMRIVQEKINGTEEIQIPEKDGK